MSAYLNGHLHAAFGERLHRLHPTSPAGGGHLAELETAAWKDDRRFRVLALDAGALSFADYYFHTPGSPLRPGREDQGVMQTTGGGWREGAVLAAVAPAWHAGVADRELAC